MALNRLEEYSWPGNVRELRSSIEWAAVRSKGTVRITDLPPEVIAAASPDDSAAPHPLDERLRILRAIQEAGGNRSDAARRLGISRATLYRRIADLGLNPKSS